MTACPPQDARALEAAFHAFNQRSVELERSYRELEGQVATLTTALAASQSARHRELLEKERLGDRLARMIEALPGAVVVLDDAGIIRERNAEAAALLNQPLLGRPWSEIVQREFSAGAGSDGELRLGDGRVLSLNRRRLGKGQGEVLLLTDVTESRRMADLLARHERLSSIGEMTSRLAHQIRTPLASALLYASQLTPGSAADDSPAGRIVSRLRELDRLVNDMLQFAGGARQHNDRIDIADLLDDVAETGRARLEDGESVQVASNAGAAGLAGNRDALKGALLNLLDNAAAASPAGGRIELGAVLDNDRLCLTVTDQGEGMPAGMQSKVFEPFFTTRPQGTGLGLAVVRSVAETHGGEVLIDSSAAGTTVAICLPAVTETACEREACHG